MCHSTRAGVSVAVRTVLCLRIINHLVYYTTVQEQPIFWGSSTRVMAVLFRDQAAVNNAEFHFTDISLAGSPAYAIYQAGGPFGQILFKDCQFVTAGLAYQGSGSSSQILSF